MISSVLTEKSQLAVRIPTGSRPAMLRQRVARRGRSVRVPPRAAATCWLHGSRNGCRSRGRRRPERAPPRDAAGPRRRDNRNSPGSPRAPAARRMRGMAWRAPYWPWLIRIGLSSPSRSGIVSWSASKLMATAQRAPLGQAFGLMLRPARARPTIRRQVAPAIARVRRRDA